MRLRRMPPCVSSDFCAPLLSCSTRPQRGWFLWGILQASSRSHVAASKGAHGFFRRWLQAASKRAQVLTLWRLRSRVSSLALREAPGLLLGPVIPPLGVRLLPLLLRASNGPPTGLLGKLTPTEHVLKRGSRALLWPSYGPPGETNPHRTLLKKRKQCPLKTL